MKIELKIIGEFIHQAKKKNKQKNATQKKHRSIALVEFFVNRTLHYGAIHRNQIEKKLLKLNGWILLISEPNIIFFGFYCCETANI